MADQIAVSIKGVSKQFLLPHEKKSSLKSVFTGMLKPSGKPTTQQALKDISFDIKKGEFFGIVGRNGSGKSTLLKIIAGIYQPTKGTVNVHGKLVPFIELGVGFNPELTGRENVYLNGSILGFDTKQIDANYKKIVDFAELEEFMDQKLKNYSSGMQVRLAFACATMAEADILLIDEVLAVGDADFQRKCFDYFKKIKKQGTTVVFVTHDMNAVREYCDRVVLINDSKIMYTGDPESTSEQYIKLFSKEEHTEAPSEVGEHQRWGNGAMEISAPKVKVTATEVTITYSVSNISKDVARLEPVFGIVIEDAAGLPIMGTNTKILRKKIEYKNKVTISWSFSNIFSSGEHIVNLAVHARNGVDVYDWWNDAIRFSVENKYNTPYPVSPSIHISY